MEDLFLIAEIKSAFGSYGDVQVESFSDFKERFFDLKKVFVEIFGTRKELYVESVKEIDKKIILKFVGFDSSAQVKNLIGKKLFVDDDGVVKLSDGVYFIHDVIGSSVLHNGNIIGVVEDVLIYPANDVFVIRDHQKRKILIAAVKDFIKNFTVEKKLLELADNSELLYDDEI